MAISVAAPAEPPADRSALERERALLASSIWLVASGAARRVTHVGLAFAAEILPEAQSDGREHGVVVRARGSIDADDREIIVEPIG